MSTKFSLETVTDEISKISNNLKFSLETVTDKISGLPNVKGMFLTKFVFIVLSIGIGEVDVTG